MARTTKTDNFINERITTNEISSISQLLLLDSNGIKL